MKISVITASFNQGPYIKRCLESVLSQTGDFAVEHIVLDNCSTDETSKILQGYSNTSTHVDVKILVRPDLGQTPTINEGFHMASGDVICWLNTDERYKDGALQMIADFFRTHPDVDVVFGNCDFIDRNGILVKQKKEFFFSQSMLIFYGCFMPSCSTFLRRRVLDQGFYLDPEFKVTMDFDWYVRIAKAGFRIKHLSKNLASFTWHDTNISSILSCRRKKERLLVQERYSGVKGPKILRLGIYLLMRVYWIIVRNILRLVKYSG